MPELSIIIVCYKGWERLQKCLNSLDSLSGKSFRAEVIVVDNKSGDDEIYIIESRYHRFRFIYNNVNGGFANGSNLGAKNATGSYLLFLNPDTVANEDGIAKLLNIAQENPDYAIISCRQVNETGKESHAYGQFPSISNLTGFQRAFLGAYKPKTSSLHQDICFPDWISGSVVMIRRETFQKMGGFDEDFWMYFEDVDLCRRTSGSNGNVAFCNSVTIEHNHGGSSRINLKTTTLTKTEVNISKHVYIWKNKSGIERILTQIFLVFNNLISGGVMAFIGLLLFFIPKVFSRTLIYLRLIRYYAGCLFRLSWISPRSVNFHKN
jgi:GT2 family glycosyltransferase